MALLTSQTIPVSGLTASYGAAAATDTITPESGVVLVLHVKNGSGVTDTVTLVVPGTGPFGQANPDVAVAVLATSEQFIFLKNQGLLTDPATGLISVTHSAITTVTVAVLRILT